MDRELIYLTAEEEMVTANKRLLSNFSKISVGRANPKLVENIKVEYYETLTPISQLASISVPEPRQLLITPFDKSVVKSIVGVINSISTLGFNAQDEGDKIRINIPEITGERRRQLSKKCHEYSEESKVAIRHARQIANKAIKALKLSEDEEKDALNEIQELTDKFVAETTKLTKEKDTDILTI